MSDDIDWSVFPTLGFLYERLSYYACKTEEGELNTVLNDAYRVIGKLQQEKETAKRFSDALELAVFGEVPMSKAKQKGTAAETAVVNYLKDNRFTNITGQN